MTNSLLVPSRSTPTDWGEVEDVVPGGGAFVGGVAEEHAEGGDGGGELQIRRGFVGAFAFVVKWLAQVALSDVAERGGDGVRTRVFELSMLFCSAALGGRAAV